MRFKPEYLSVLEHIMQTKLVFFAFSLFLLHLNPTASLTIEITDLKNSKGQILLEFSDSDKNVIREIVQNIEDNKCIVQITDLTSGSYSFKYFHDENSNKEMDTNWVGMPKEGFGFSNNAKGTFGPPAHEKTIFEIKSDTTVNCTPIYLKKK